MEIGQWTTKGVIVDVNGSAVLIRSDTTNRTRWCFANELQVISRSLSFIPESFPLGFQTFDVIPSTTSNENLLILLHGFGDTHQALLKLGKAMELPQTAVLSIRAPNALPFDLGYSWYHAFDEQGNLLPAHVENTLRLQSLQELLLSWKTLLHVLQKQYGWSCSRIFLMGFGQVGLGGDVALHVASSCENRLGGVVGIEGTLLQQPVKESKLGTPVLLLHRVNNNLINSHMWKQCKQWCEECFISVESKLFNTPEPINLALKVQMTPVMEFFANHLYLRNFALEQHPDIIQIH